MPIFTAMFAMIVPAIAIAASKGEIATGGNPPRVMIAVSTSVDPTISSNKAMPRSPKRPAAHLAATAAKATNSTKPNAGSRAIGLPGGVGASHFGAVR